MNRERKRLARAYARNFAAALLLSADTPECAWNMASAAEIEFMDELRRIAARIRRGIPTDERWPNERLFPETPATLRADTQDPGL